MSSTQTSDYLIIGGGIMGLTIARSLRARFPNASITLIEKESHVAHHASGRNSGVLHAGFYYSADSLKAKFCREGNKALRSFVTEYGLKINDCKKVVVTQNEEELSTLHQLLERGKANDVPLELVDEQQLAEIEPNAKTYKQAIYSPTTAIVDPIEVCDTLRKELKRQNVTFLLNTPYQTRVENNIVTAGNQQFEAGHIINCAGLYADQIARQFDFCQDYTIVPFKGVYLKYSGKEQPINSCIYTVPNMRNPFLGVHYSVTVDGTVKIGPTAIPAFWRENYKGLKNFSFQEMRDILRWEIPMFLFDFKGFGALALRETRKYSKRHMASLAAGMVKDIDFSKFDTWMRPGIRAQLVHKSTLKLLHDFVVEGDEHSTHILNAVSPAFTSSFPFAEWVVNQHIAPDYTSDDYKDGV